MRVLVLALAVVLSPVGATLCEVVCADTGGAAVGSPSTHAASASARPMHHGLKHGESLPARHHMIRDDMAGATAASTMRAACRPDDCSQGTTPPATLRNGAISRSVFTQPAVLTDVRQSSPDPDSAYTTEPPPSSLPPPLRSSTPLRI